MSIHLTILLQVTATNPVSSETVEVILTADVMIPIAQSEFVSVNEVIAVAATHLYNFRVKVDISLGVTFRSESLSYELVRFITC